MRHVIVVSAAILALTAPAAHAHERDVPIGPILGGIVQERDVGLVFDYLREALDAAMEGREAPPPEELTQRAEVIGEALKRRGADAARAILDSVESAVREGMREPRAHPLPPQPGRIRI